MLVDGAGKLIVDVLTAERSLASISSASAILDASNYTIQAVSFGKDADGFKFHAHKILNPSAQSVIPSNTAIKVVSYQPLTASSYHTSATEISLEHIYRILPESPSPLNTRLESKSTLPNYSSGVVDIGHCLNSAVSINLSSHAHLIGCFAPSGHGFKYWAVSSELSPSTSVIYSGTLYSNFNEYKLMDSSGFLTFASGDATYHATLTNDNTKGAVRLIEAGTFPNKVTYKIYIAQGDAGSLSLFGGLYHIGLWYLDLKTLLSEGKTPPYSFNYLNNIRKYKLFAKKTFNKNLLTVNDFGVSSGFNFTHDYPYQGPALTLNWELYFV